METSTSNFKFILGCDHAGFELKEIIKKYLISKKFNIEDVGSFTPERCDYPDLAEKLSIEVIKNKFHRGILVCGSGIGISIAANKFKGIRCGLVHDNYTVKKALEENYCNVISLGGRILGEKLALSLVDVFVAHGEFVEDEKYKNKLKDFEALEA